ncbi:MAG: RNA polymerase sigma factor [Acidobacteria bacterium]|nr:RNA polymerase sigma factor [Acidobacteriota bacterium]
MISFKNMYQKYERDVFRFAYWLCRNAHDAEDISSETFVRAWAGSGRLNAQTLKGYLFKIARNLWLDQLKQKKRKLSDPDVITDPGQNPEEYALGNETAELVQNALADLRSSDRHILFLRFTEELSYREIADCLGLSMAAVKVALHRAKKRLGKRIKEES